MADNAHGQMGMLGQLLDGKPAPAISRAQRLDLRQGLGNYPPA